MSKFLPRHGTVQGFVMAILIPSIVSALATFIYMKIVAGGNNHGWILFMSFMMTLFFAFIGCTFVGIPVHLILQRMRWTSKWSYVFAGFLSTNLFAATLLLENSPEMPVNFSAFIIPYLICGGPLAAFVFWRWARPDLIDTSI